jgi:organic hydroperoxide reductase OsmC/OhrA
VENQEFSVDLELREGYRFGVDFDQDWVPTLQVDEPAPLGAGDGPNAKLLLAAAVGNCMSSSLLFCLRRARVEVVGLRTRVSGTVVRNPQGRLRIGELRVSLLPTLSPEDAARSARCMELFQDFCVVGESVRQGIPLRVEVELDEAAAVAAYDEAHPGAPSTAGRPS